MANIQEIVGLVKARIPVIWINTFEEKRLIKEIIHSEIIGVSTARNLQGDNVEVVTPDKKVYIWSCTQGLIKVEKDSHTKIDMLECEDKSLTIMTPQGAIQSFVSTPVPDSCIRSILIMRDIHHHMKAGPQTSRKIRDIISSLSQSRKTIIIVAPSQDIPEDLRKDIYFINYDLPTAEEIEKRIRADLEELRQVADTDDKKGHCGIIGVDGKTSIYRYLYSDQEIREIVKVCLGFTQQEMIQAISRSLKESEGEIVPDIIAAEKKNIIRRSKILEYWTDCIDIGSVGGNGAIKDWLNKRSVAFTGNALKYGARIPKGVVIVGIQGCGKSMLAKAIPKILGLPLIRLDFGRIYAGLVGSSENNMREAIVQAESMAPSVLWIDEIEKGLSGTGSSNFSDGGTTSRVFGTFTTWMQEKTKPVFVVATANDLSQLNPEILRKGRFDDIWFVDLPTREERLEIFRIHLTKSPIKRNIGRFDLEKLSACRFRSRDGQEYDYSGSEIEEAINDAIFDVLYQASTEGREVVLNGAGDIDTDAIVKALQATTPLSCTASEKIQRTRLWGKKHAKFASAKAERELKVPQVTGGEVNVEP